MKRLRELTADVGMASRLAIAVTLLATVAGLAWNRHQFRSQIRAQIIQRDGQILQAMAIARQIAAEEDGTVDGEDQFAALLEISRFDGLLAARLFRPDGTFVASIPTWVQETELDPVTLSAVRTLKPVSQFYRRMALDQIFLSAPTQDESAAAPIPVLVVHVPLHRTSESELTGVAQFLIEGYSVAHEFRMLDRRLAIQGAIALVGLLLVVGTVLGLTFRRLERTNRVLQARTADLQRANQELAHAARVSALGAVTAHLIHSLKNPVSGLQSFVAARQEQRTEADGEWREALSATHRVQSLIQQVVEVLRGHETDGRYEIGLGELAETLVGRLRPVAQERDVILRTTGNSAFVMDSRTSSILGLILSNLLQNAIEATPAGGEVRLELWQEAGKVVCAVHDQGQGIPLHVQERLFVPTHSSKDGGSGIGLAISKQLANHLGAEIVLIRSTSGGTVFHVVLPVAAATAPPGMPETQVAPVHA